MVGCLAKLLVPSVFQYSERTSSSISRMPMTNTTNATIARTFIQGHLQWESRLDIPAKSQPTTFNFTLILQLIL
jgi:hypothetical protein